MNAKQIRSWIVYGVIGLVGVMPCAAQVVTATLLGTVTDPSGAGMAGTAVVAINEDTQERHSVTTNASGDYLLTALPVGQYRLEVEYQGFKKYVRTGIVLELNQNARVDAKLEVGQVNQEVLVAGSAPLVDTYEVQLGGTVDTKRINDLPLNGRNVYGLVTLLPGVSGVSLQAQPDVGQGTQMNVNGARTLTTSFLLDGGLNNNVFRDGGLQAPNPDAVEEFRLITSNYNAEYGRSGGGIVNVITKSGTNQFHGTLFEYLRNSDLNARAFFTPTVSDLKQNQFGGTLGGPVKHDKLFFFFSYQGSRQRAGQFMNTARTPTAAQRLGDFSAVPANQRPHDPDSQVPFPNGIIPASRLDPVAQNILNKLVPLPNTPDGRVEAAASQSVNSDEYLGKGDYLLSAAHRLTVSTFFVRANNLFPFQGSNIPGYSPTITAPGQNNITGTETWNIGPALLNQVSFGYTRGTTLRNDVNKIGLPDLGSKITIGSLPVRPPTIGVTNGWSGGSGGYLSEADQIYNLHDSVTWNKGAHSLKVGGMYERFAFDYDSTAAASGSIGATGAFTGNAFSDFELGRGSFAADTKFAPHMRSRDWGLFAQDDWKIARRITLNLGLRYDVFSPFTSLTDQFSQWIPGEQSKRFPTAPLGMVFPGDTGVPRGLVPTRYGNFAPRFGIAYDPFGDGKTAIRAGFGIYYSADFAGLYNADYGQPFDPTVMIVQTPSLVNPYANLNTPFPLPPGASTFVLPVLVPWMNTNNVIPYVEQYNFTVQRQLVQNVSLDVAYVGNASHHLELQRDFNSPIYMPGKSTSANVNQRRPYLPGIIGTIPEAETSANANYNALQVSLNRRFSRGVTLLANYSYAKAIDTQSATQQNQAVGFTDSNNLSIDRGPSGFDVRQVFNLSFVWETPRIASLGFVGKQVLGNWQVNGIARYTTGRPYTVTSGIDSNLDGNNNDRPDLIGVPQLSTDRSKSQKLARYFDPTAFRAAGTGLDGTAGRNILYGPGSQNWDMSFFKSITLGEHRRLQFRAEFFNIFNRANFANPNSLLSNPNVGQILGASAGRVIQFGLRFAF